MTCNTHERFHIAFFTLVLTTCVQEEAERQRQKEQREEAERKRHEEAERRKIELEETRRKQEVPVFTLQLFRQLFIC